MGRPSLLVPVVVVVAAVAVEAAEAVEAEAEAVVVAAVVAPPVLDLCHHRIPNSRSMLSSAACLARLPVRMRTCNHPTMSRQTNRNNRPMRSDLHAYIAA